ncbi:MAG: RDD family protein [Anaerolineales bacterium]|nr:RDD family protein [Anaerolineales bacterium]
MPRQPQRKTQEEEITFVGHYAGFVTRLSAFLIDILVVTLTTSLIWGVVALILQFFGLDLNTVFYTIASTSQVLFLFVVVFASFGSTLVLGFVYNVFLWMFAGKTLGKAVMGIRVIGPRGSRVTFWRGLRRYLGYWISAIPLFLGYFWVLVTDERVAWHDIFARTHVIYDYEAKYSEALLGRLARMIPRVEKNFNRELDQNDE